MKNKFLLLAILVSVSQLSYADKPDADKFFYDKGFKDGKTEGMRVGYAKARKEIMSKLKSRLSAIKAMEAGKYLSKKHKITAPQIYQLRKADGSLSIQVKGCRLEGELTPEEIVMLPKYDNPMSDIGNARGLLPSTTNGSTQGVSNGVFLPGIDTSNAQTPHMASSMTNTVYKYLPNTEFYIKLLRTSGFPFTVTNGGTNLKIRFGSEHEALTFLSRYDLKPGRDAK